MCEASGMCQQVQDTSKNVTLALGNVKDILNGEIRIKICTQVPQM